MGDPATPTAKERAETRELCRRIVESVRNDEPFPHDLTTMIPTRGSVNQEAAEEACFDLAQEVCALQADYERMSRQEQFVVDQALAAYKSYEARLAAMTKARDELAGIAHELHGHKCPSYDTGEECPFRDRLDRVAELRKVGQP